MARPPTFVIPGAAPAKGGLRKALVENDEEEVEDELDKRKGKDDKYLQLYSSCVQMVGE